jgi:uncharacterized protein
MTEPSREFQVFAKPVGPTCNLKCQYCYYLKKKDIYPEGESFRMPDDILEEYIVQHIEASTEPVISFSWHGGEPTLLGLDYFRKIVDLQRRHQPLNRRIANGLQTNGTLLDDAWCRFLAAEGFAVGISIDGPQEFHDRYRLTGDQKSTFKQTMRGYKLLLKHRVLCEVLCVVNEGNVQSPIQVYRFLKQLKARYISFLPLVEPVSGMANGVSRNSVPSEAFGMFLCAIFDEWKARDIGRVKVQIFEEAARTAFGQEHTLCVFRKVCGGVPVIEHNGDFYSCDHFVDAEHCLGNIQEKPLVELLESPAQKAFGQAKLESLPSCCRACEVRSMCNGGCKKNRFLLTQDGEPGLNYLCAGYKRFFKHCQPFVREIANEWHRQTPKVQVPQTSTAGAANRQKTGRNDPCPCNSGKKYKNCCIGP